jgi:phosphate transport system permease protein
MVWLTGGSLALGLVMVLGLLTLVISRGLATFWPEDVVRFTTSSGEVALGELRDAEERVLDEAQIAEIAQAIGEEAVAALRASAGRTERRLVRSVDLADTTKARTAWYDDYALAGDDQGLDGRFERVLERPTWALAVERFKGGRYYGELEGFVDGDRRVEGAEAAWPEFERALAAAEKQRADYNTIIEHEIGALSRRSRAAELDARKVALESGEGSAEHTAAVERARELARVNAEATARLQEQASAIETAARAPALLVRNAAGDSELVEIWDIVRAYPANTIGFFASVAVYVDRWFEFLFEDPRKANTEGGVYPAIFGTVLLTLLMCFAVVPFGVLAALYLREYAKQGLAVSVVRIAVNNLAGVPSIVFGVFGLGFFCYWLGGDVIDPLFFPEYGNQPVFGGGGILWASLTLALLTLPVVIVATEEALSSVPGSMREGSYACGATKWQTIRRIVLPRAMPGIMTGTILAIARGAGEVAPLMLVGAMKEAASLPISGEFPFIHPERRFMHLGSHIYDLGFQSPDSEAAIPMVYTTTFLLIAIVVGLNLVGVWIRARLRRRFAQAAI